MALQIKNIVNCQGMESKNFHEKDNYFEYMRFPVSEIFSRKPVFDVKNNEGIL